MYLVVGLGNPGKEYENTRHNVGFRALDALAKALQISIEKKKWDAIVGEGNVAGEKVLLAKPQTYMNLSGTSVQQIVNFYHVPLNHVIILYDDIDIALGKIRIRENGSAGTHNGMRNVVEMLQTDDFPRVRIGTGKPPVEIPLMNYVLTPFTKEEQSAVEKGIQSAADATLTILREDIQTAMNLFNGK